MTHLNTNHTHQWRRVYEDSIIGIGPHPAGFECIDCKEWVSQGDAGPNMGGVLTDEMRLVGPHGGRGQCSDGSTYKEQIYRNGKLEIIR